MFSEKITAYKDDNEGDGEERIGVAHFGFREDKEPENDTDSIEEKSYEKEWIREEYYAGFPDTLMSSKSPSSPLPENLGDTVECSRKKEYNSSHDYSLEAIKRKCGYGNIEAIFS